MHPENARKFICNDQDIWRPTPSLVVQWGTQSDALGVPRYMPVLVQNGAQFYAYGVVAGSAIKSISTALSVRLMTRLGCENVNRRELTVRTYVSPAARPSNV